MTEKKVRRRRNTREWQGKNDENDVVVSLSSTLTKSVYIQKHQKTISQIFICHQTKILYDFSLLENSYLMIDKKKEYLSTIFTHFRST